MSARLFECRNCGGFNGYRSRPRNFMEKFVFPLLLLRPVRCGDCSRRSYQLTFVPARPRRESKKEPNAAALTVESLPETFRPAILNSGLPAAGIGTGRTREARLQQ